MLQKTSGFPFILQCYCSALCFSVLETGSAVFDPKNQWPSFRTLNASFTCRTTEGKVGKEMARLSLIYRLLVNCQGGKVALTWRHLMNTTMTRWPNLASLMTWHSDLLCFPKRCNENYITVWTYKLPTSRRIYRVLHTDIGHVSLYVSRFTLGIIWNQMCFFLRS